MSPRECPCTSGKTYADCCAPYHKLTREPPDPVALMRSRYAAFATKQVEYLWRTLHANHADRGLAKADAIIAIREACQKNRYMGLVVLDHEVTGELNPARVLFLAKVFARGKDISFVECSDFIHDGEGWRYLAGTLVPTSNLEGDPTSLTMATLPPTVLAS